MTKKITRKYIPIDSKKNICINYKVREKKQFSIDNKLKNIPINNNNNLINNSRLCSLSNIWYGQQRFNIMKKKIKKKIKY